MAPSRPLAVVLALALAAIPAATARAQGLFLFSIPTLPPPGAAPGLDRELRVAAYVSDPAALARLYAEQRPTVESDRVILRATIYPQLSPLGPESYRAPSFLLDYDEPSVRELSRELPWVDGTAPDRRTLTRFVHALISNKSLGRGWDAASVVATTRTGDCTEHAVLLAALARSVGLSARVVVGAALVAWDGQFATLGHAWAEIHEDGMWHVADAALAPEEAPVAYLPFGVLSDEGVGHTLAIARLSYTWIRRLEILGGE